MKKGLLFVGLIVAMTLICCYALVAADAVNKKIDNVVAQKKAAVIQEADLANDASAVLSNHAVLPRKAPVISPLQDASASLSADPRIVELLDIIDDLKSQGLYDADIWNELFSLLSPVHRPSRHFDQGGEDCATAVVLSGALPINTTGTTVGYADDYEESGVFNCPYTSTSGDVVYKYTPSADIFVDIDLCNSAYDTKLMVYSGTCASLLLEDCDDDGCPGGTYRSLISGLALSAATDYYIVIDGYGGDEGAYDLTISEADAPPPPPECPANTLFGQPVHLPDDSWTAGVSDLRTGSGYSQLIRYENFSGVTSEICDIHWWGLSLSYPWTACDEDPMSFEIIFYNNVAGANLPDVDNPVCTYNVTLARQETGLLYAGYPLYYWGTTLSPCCAITNGWVSIQGTSVGSPDCWFLWMSSGVGDAASLLYDVDTGTWTTEDFDLSICLTGEGGELYGACCDPVPGECFDDVLSTECQPPYLFYANTLCADIDPPCGMGACCDLLTGECTMTDASACQGADQEWHPGITCDPNPCPEPPCTVDCPAGATLEGEPTCCDEYEDTFNGGCNSTPPVFSPITCGETVCGESGTYLFGGSNYRDTDWYEITTTEPFIFTWDVVAEFTVLIFAIDAGSGDCSDYDILASASADECVNATVVTECMPAGTYYFWVGPSVFEGIPCGEMSEYVATLTCETCEIEPCVPDYTGSVDCTDSYTHSSTTVGAGDDCDFEISEDIIYEIAVGEDATYEFSLCNTDELDAWDSRIYVHDDCCAGTQLGYDDDDCDSPVGLMSRISCDDRVALTVGTYYVTIEGYSGDAGAYQLDITCCEPPCDTVNYCENPIEIPPSENDPPPPNYFYQNTANSCCATDEVDCVWKEECFVDPCWTSGPDVIYLMHTWVTSTIMTITASGPCDNQVMVFTDCNDPVNTCVGTADYTFGGQDEVITLTNLPPGIYYISTSCYGSSGCDEITLTIESDVQLPVELSSFEAVAGNREVALTWTTAAELNNDYFEIQRSTDSDWTTVGTVEGTNDVTGSSYDYTDRAVVNGVTYTYRLLSHDINGAVNEYEMTAEATPEAPIPTEYALAQNFPNPFNPNTTISYALKDAGFVTLKVYNLLGQEVATLVAAEFTAGRYTATFMATDLPSGVYIYRLDVNDFTATKKMVLMK